MKFNCVSLTLRFSMAFGLLSFRIAFFGLTICLTGLLESFGVLIRNESKFLGKCGTLSVEVTNTLVTTKVLGAKLNWDCFFFKQKIFSFRKVVALFFVCLFCRLSCHVLKFFALWSFLFVAFYVFIYSCNL